MNIVVVLTLMYVIPVILCLIATRLSRHNPSHHESQIPFFTFKPIANIAVSIWALLVILDRLERRKRESR